MKDMFKIISFLLLYPDENIKNIDWQELVSDIDVSEIKQKILEFAGYIENTPLIKLQQNYVNTFDFDDDANLYITYSKKIEEKERGQALADLQEIYKNEGFEINSSELPDFLPLFLEFLSICSEETMILLKQRFREALELRKNKLEEINSPYKNLFQILLKITNKTLKETL